VRYLAYIWYFMFLFHISHCVKVAGWGSCFLKSEKRIVENELGDSGNCFHLNIKIRLLTLVWHLMDDTDKYWIRKVYLLWRLPPTLSYTCRARMVVSATMILSPVKLPLQILTTEFTFTCCSYRYWHLNMSGKDFVRTIGWPRRSIDLLNSTSYNITVAGKAVAPT